MAYPYHVGFSASRRYRPFSAAGVDPAGNTSGQAGYQPFATYVNPDSTGAVEYTRDPLRGAASFTNAGGNLPSYSALIAQMDLAENQRRAALAGQVGALGPGGAPGPGYNERLAAYQAGGGGTLAGGGEGTGVASGSGTPDATDPGAAYQGFASRYVPGERDLLFGPGGGRTILHDYLSQDGRHNFSNLEGDLGRYADNAFRFYQLLQQGDTSNPANQADDTIINWVANLMKEQSTVGGKSPSVRAMLEGLFEGFRDKDSTLGSTFFDAKGNPVGTEEQIQAVMQAIPLLGEFSNDAYASTLYKSAQRRAQEYRSMVAKGKAKGQTFLDYLDNSNFAGGGV